MKLKLFGYEIELRRETEEEALKRSIAEGLPAMVGWWWCPICCEKGRFEAMGVEDTGKTWFPSGAYDWRAYPEMRCRCRRASERAE